MIKAIAVDDDKIALKVIENFCAGLDYIKIEKTFTDPTEALVYLNKYPADLVFLDIDMPYINGLELSKKIKQETMVIFTTTHTEYAIEGFNLNAVDYIGKPYTHERFEQALKKAKTFFSTKTQEENSDEPKYLFLRADYALNKISIADISYIQGLDDYIKIFVVDKKPLVVRMTMSEILKKLPTNQFTQVHRSYIVATTRIEKVKNKTVIVGANEIPIGPKYEKEVTERFAGK